MTTAPYSLGRLVHHDPRSRAYGVPLAGRLVSKLWRLRGPVLDQGETQSCTGHAAAHCLSAMPGSTRVCVEGDAMSLYAIATTRDPFPWTYPPTDEGSSGLGVAKAAKSIGWIKGYRHAFSLAATLAALTRGPVIAGLPWKDSMFTPVNGRLLDITGADVGGHEVALTGIDVPGKMVKLQNSWGPSWGTNGAALLSWTDLGTLLKDQGDVTVFEV